MTHEALKRHLQDLHQELASSDALDPETHALLTQVANDIETVLADEAGDHESVRGRIEDAALQFEASYPRLSRAMSEVTDALAKIGI